MAWLKMNIGVGRSVRNYSRKKKEGGGKDMPWRANMYYYFSVAPALIYFMNKGKQSNWGLSARSSKTFACVGQFIVSYDISFVIFSSFDAAVNRHYIFLHIMDAAWMYSTLVSATLQYSLRKSLGFYRQWYRVFGNRVAFFHFISEEKINDTVEQNPIATGTVEPIKI